MTQPIINKAELWDRIYGDTELLAELIHLFFQDFPQLMQTMRAALAAGDTEALKKSAHALKGSVGNFSAYPAYRAALKVETIAADGNLADACEAVNNLACEMRRLEIELTSLLAEAKEESEAGSEPGGQAD